MGNARWNRAVRTWLSALKNPEVAGLVHRCFGEPLTSDNQKDAGVLLPRDDAWTPDLWPVLSISKRYEERAGKDFAQVGLGSCMPLLLGPLR